MIYFDAICLLSLIIIIRCVAQDSTGYDRDALQRLTEYRQQHRKTINGELCAAAFVQDGQTYTDCTIARSPDGTIGREWCYVEYQNSRESGSYWNFCVEVINYDTVRAKAKEIFELKEHDMRRAAIEVRNQTGRLREALQKYSQLCKAGHEAVPGRIMRIKKSINASAHTVYKLEAFISKIKYIESTIATVKEDIKKDRMAAYKDKTNCAAIRGYEDDPEADGLRGSYYNNARFEGIPTAYKDDPTIDFVWDEISPLPSIPIHHFSVRWDGYLMAPETGKYVFSTLADCGVRVFLGGSAIIVDRMPTPMEGDALSENVIDVLPPQNSTAILKVYSQAQPLVGGQKYKIRIEYFHLSTLKWSNPLVARVTLNWNFEGFAEQVVPRERFFKSNPKKPLRISGLPGKYFGISVLEDGAHAFINSKDHFISDVPLRYQGAKLLRTKYNPKFERLHITVSAPCTFYVAAPRIKGNPISSDDSATKFVFTKGLDNVTILKAKTFMTINQTSLTIYGAKLDSGSVGLKVRAGIPYFMFFMPSKATEGKCTGEAVIVSRTDSETFDDCTTSSYNKESFNCKAALSGINQDIQFGAWRTTGGYGIGQYLSVTFTKPIQLSAFQFKTRDQPETWPSEVELHFSGTPDIEKINIIPGDHTYQLKVSQVATSVKVVVSHMRDDTRPNDTGGSMAFIGIPCISHKEVASTEGEEEDTNSIAISFKAGFVGILPAGYRLDDGSPKQRHGKFVYGWEKRASPPTGVDCENAVFLQSFTHGGIQFPQKVSDLDCATGAKYCTQNSWSIDLFHYGYYKVTVEVGSPCGGEQLHNLAVNGIPFVTGEILKRSEYVTVIGNVLLYTSPTITLTSTTGTTLQTIKIQKLYPKTDYLG